MYESVQNSEEWFALTLQNAHLMIQQKCFLGDLEWDHHRRYQLKVCMVFYIAVH